MVIYIYKCICIDLKHMLRFNQFPLRTKFEWVTLSQSHSLGVFFYGRESEVGKLKEQSQSRSSCKMLYCNISQNGICNIF